MRSSGSRCKRKASPATGQHRHGRVWRCSRRNFIIFSIYHSRVVSERHGAEVQWDRVRSQQHSWRLCAGWVAPFLAHSGGGPPRSLATWRPPPAAELSWTPSPAAWPGSGPCAASSPPGLPASAHRLRPAAERDRVLGTRVCVMWRRPAWRTDDGADVDQEVGEGAPRLGDGDAERRHVVHEEHTCDHHHFGRWRTRPGGQSKQYAPGIFCLGEPLIRSTFFICGGVGARAQ
jgi:hypothetical protein